MNDSPRPAFRKATIEFALRLLLDVVSISSFFVCAYYALINQTLLPIAVWLALLLAVAIAERRLLPTKRPRFSLKRHDR
jgi:hypothetical protein